MKFYGREKEIAFLRKIRGNSLNHAQFTVITGRRRIGKTELIRHAYEDRPFLYFFVARRTVRKKSYAIRSAPRSKTSSVCSFRANSPVSRTSSNG